MDTSALSDLSERHYTVAEAATLLSLNYYSMLRYIRTGRIRSAVRLGIAKGNPHLIPESELRRFVEERTNRWMTVRNGKLVISAAGEEAER